MRTAYNDLVILPIKENMNNGKTHAYFTWAHSSALVPPALLLPSPPEHDNYTTPLHSSDIPPWYRLYTAEHEGKLRRGPAPDKLAPHDPLPTVPVMEQTNARTRRSNYSRFPKHLTSTPELFPKSTHDHFARALPQEWVKPDFVVKADDDSFVMLAELEARLRWELWEAKRDAEAEAGNGSGGNKAGEPTTRVATSSTDGGSSKTARSDVHESASETGAESSTTEDGAGGAALPSGAEKRELPEGMILNRRDWVHMKASVDDPLIYWGCE